MSSQQARKLAIQAELKTLQERKTKLEMELKAIHAAEEKAQAQSFAHLPRDMETLSEWWKENKVDRDQIKKMWEFLWCANKEYLTFRGQNVYDYITDMLEDVEDCMAEIYFDLQSVRFVGPFAYGDEDAERQSATWQTKKTAFCAFAK